MAALLRGALWFASAIGLGATLQRWFGFGEDNENDPLGIMGYVRLAIVGAIVYIIFKVIGKKFPK